jgi:transketolase
VIVLTRQGLPVMERPSGGSVPAAVGGAGVVVEPAKKPQLVLVAAGSEVSLCKEAAAKLESDGVATRVVSIPCLEAFHAAAADAQASLLPPGVPRLCVEAGTGLSWQFLCRTGDAFHGLHRYGASAPGAEVAKHLGLNADAVYGAARELVRGS